MEDYLIKKVAEKDYTALEIIYKETSSIIYSLALSITRNREDAEDVLHDTYIKLAEKAYMYEPTDRPLAWLCRITKNLCLMKLRKQKRQTDYDLSNDVNYANIKNHDNKIILETAFKILKEDELQIILLYSSSGFKHREISEILDIPLSTVLSKYNRSLKKMKDYLEGSLK